MFIFGKSERWPGFWTCLFFSRLLSRQSRHGWVWAYVNLCQSMVNRSCFQASASQLPWVSSFYASFYFYVFLFVADAVASKVPVTEEETAGLLQLQPVEPLEALEAPVAQTFYGPAAAPGQFWYPPFLPPQTQFAQLSPSWENRRGDRETWTAGPYGQSEMKLHRFAGQGRREKQHVKTCWNMSFPRINLHCCSNYAPWVSLCGRCEICCKSAKSSWLAWFSPSLTHHDEKFPQKADSGD